MGFEMFLNIVTIDIIEVTSEQRLQGVLVYHLAFIELCWVNHPQVTMV